MHELADQRFTRRDVGVRLDPHRPDRHELARGDLVGDASEQLGMVLLDPGVLLSLGTGEDVLGMPVHQHHLVGEGARTLAAGLAQWPEPGGVDVGVSGRRDRVRARMRRLRQDLDQFGPTRRRRTHHVVEIERIEGPFEGAEDQVAAWAVGRQLDHETGERLEVEDQVPDLVVADPQLGSSQAIERRLAGGRPVAERVRRVRLREVGIAGRLDQQVDGLAAGDG